MGLIVESLRQCILAFAKPVAFRKGDVEEDYGRVRRGK